MYLINRSKKIIPLLAFTIAVAGCSGQKSDEEYLTLAKASIAQGEANAAIINLKNLLSANAQNVEGRFLLGKSYLNLGLWISAEKELERVYKKGYDTALVIPLLAKAYYHLGDLAGLEALLIQLDSFSEETQAILKTFTAIAYIKEESIEQGIIYLYDVVEVDYDSKYTELSKAWKQGMDNNISQAIATVDSILINSPEFAEAIEYKAYLFFKEQEMAQAAEYFGKYIVLHPQAHELRMMYAMALVYSEKYKAAEQQVDLLLVGLPNNPKLNEMKAQTRFALNDYEQAKRYAEIALRGNNSSVLAKVIAGVSAFQLNQLEVAYSQLNSVSNDLSYQHPAKKLLNALKFQLGYEQDVFAELSNVSNDQVDLETLGISASELFRLGKVAEANALLAKAAETAPDNADVLYQQGALKFFSGDNSAAGYFEKALEKNPELESAMSMLLLERLKVNDFEKALEIANNIAKDNPELSLSYKGIIYVRKNELDNAKKAFEQVLTINENNTGAYFKLGQVYELEKNFEAAIKQYQKSLNLNINLPLVVSALLRIGQDVEHRDSVRSYFEQFVKTNNSEFLSHIYLTAFYIVKGELDTAESIVSQGLVRLPNNIQLLMLKGKVQANNKHYDDAIESFNKVLKLNAFSPETLIAKSNVLELKGSFSDAIEVQKKGVALMPNSPVHKLQLAQLYIKNNDLKNASEILTELQLSDKPNIHIERLIGKVAFLNNDFSKAHHILAEVVKTINSEEVIFQLSTSLQQLNRSVEALAVIERYKKSGKAHNTLDLELKYAELLEKEQPNKALQVYMKILDKSDRHYSMLNNAAMLFLKQGNHQQAINYAREALAAVPDNSSVQNTLGLTLLAVGQNKEAERHLQQASTANQHNANYKVHLAQALFANGKADKAKSSMLNMNSKELNDFTLPRYQALTKILGIN
ncbi:XrtA/PEP-CTERM system TPR-repeat protein PrsT [Cognaticolwellia beringensis]|uniref:PEP-CTERM system TPR-repeat protein PrsT n=1 Tax=Cognaticolwellia beringensis TaxID=1967665 RepID=A0A222G7X5_9GAMM|nr:XrtA/PEP-CTERM system TPR-repeat protein PrsT [Cognaticolwellia beringensis]ASP47998.1 PEP-CTERM system TPR-repeat protein PrsT [Cognaticolwellia beringensis]